MKLVNRQEYGCPDPIFSRPQLLNPRFHLLVHYTGVGVRFNDPTKDWEYAREVISYKDWEYNFLIGLGGTVFVNGGEYLSYHCKNFNEESFGVLFMNAVDVAPTPEQIHAFLELRGWLVSLRWLTPDHEVAPHYRYRVTACPGHAIAHEQLGPWNSPTGEGALGNVIAPLLAPAIMPSNTQEDEMPKMVRVDGDAAVMLVDGIMCTWVNSVDAEAALENAGLCQPGVTLVARVAFKALELHGPAPDYTGVGAGLPGRTVPANFARWVQ